MTLHWYMLIGPGVLVIVGAVVFTALVAGGQADRDTERRL